MSHVVATATAAILASLVLLKVPSLSGLCSQEYHRELRLPVNHDKASGGGYPAWVDVLVPQWLRRYLRSAGLSATSAHRWYADTWRRDTDCRCQAELHNLRKWHRDSYNQQQQQQLRHQQDRQEGDPIPVPQSQAGASREVQGTDLLPSTPGRPEGRARGRRGLLAVPEVVGVKGGRRWQAQQVVSTHAELKSRLRGTKGLLKELLWQIEQHRRKLQRLTEEKSGLDASLSKFRPDFSEHVLSLERMGAARALVETCNKKGWLVPRPPPPSDRAAGNSSRPPKVSTWKGYACSAGLGAVTAYLDYAVRGMCPDDWFRTQQLMFANHCFALPQRRCLTHTSESFVEPLPFPRSLFDQSALIDGNLRWTHHGCKSFDCLNTRLVGSCRNCFLLFWEARRWQHGYRGSLPISAIIEMKRGSLRIGLDVGGGTGSFAAHMARHGVTIMTMAMNAEFGAGGRPVGIPYMEAIALRGLVPLHIPYKSRLPFFDNTLDIIHTVNSIKYLPMLEFEELIFEWDRILRVGGVMWFEMFYAPIEDMPVYVSIIELLQYKKLYWNVMPKPDYAEVVGLHLYLNCVLEKPVRDTRLPWSASGQ